MSARNRLLLIALVLIAAITCLALGWWQWSAFHRVGGTGRNLGYSLQWPMFAAFVVYGYYRFTRLERGTTPPQRAERPTELPDGLLPPRPAAHANQPIDPVRAEYNRHIADLYRSPE